MSASEDFTARLMADPSREAAACRTCGGERCEGTHVCTCNQYPHSIHCGSPYIGLALEKAASARDEFNRHLDACRRCADQPFNLCPVGAQLLQAAALP